VKLRKGRAAMRQTLYIVVVAALLTGVVIDIVAAGVKTVVTKNHFYWAAPASGVGIAVPSGMKNFPAELLPQ
jgi:hypothetical protein